MRAKMKASVVAALGIAILASPARALDTLPFCDSVKDPNDRMKCLQAHISHLEEQILGLSTQIANLNNQLRQKPDMETNYKLLFYNGKCLGMDDQQPAYVSCSDSDAFSFMDRTKTGLTKKPQEQPVLVPQQAKKPKNKDKDKDKNKDKSDSTSGDQNAKPAQQQGGGAGQAVPKSGQ